MKKIFHIDCTLRDGGYYNSWRFEKDLVSKYLDCMNKLNIDFIELGFRFLKNSSNFGPFASTTEELLKKLGSYKQINFAVMINIGEFSQNKLEDQLNKIFLKKKNSKVKLVRIASHKKEIDVAIKASKILKEMGYKTAINLMQISEINQKDLTKILKKLNKKFTDIFYFADSLGCLNKSQIKLICNTIKKSWKGPFGIHAHDNMEMAFSNTKSSIEYGASYVDSTVLGMGRGPGNTKTEFLCSYLNSIKKKKYNLIFLTDLVDKYFFNLKEKYSWGTNLYYFLSAQYKIHPTYIQNMLNEKKYEDNEIILAIENLKKMKCKTYSPNTLRNSKVFLKDGVNKKIINQNFEDKNVLIIANSNSLEQYQKKINLFIKKAKPIVLSLNRINPKNFNNNKIDYLAICHPTRIMSEMDLISKDTKLISPFSNFSNEIKKKIKKYKIIDYGLIIDEKNTLVTKEYCKLDKILVLPYALSFLTINKVKKIYLAGFDGYESDVISRRENNKILKKFANQKSKNYFQFITPSFYKIS